MYKIDKMKLFMTKTNKIRYDTRNEKFMVVYFGENISLVDAYKNMNILKQDLKKVFVPKFRMRSIQVLNTSDYAKRLRKQQLQVMTNTKNVYIGKDKFISHIYDSSLILNKFDDFFRGDYFNVRNQNIVFNFVKGTFDKAPEDSKKVLLYTVDISKPLSMNLKKRRVYPFVKFFRHNKDLEDICDIFMLCILGYKNPIYIKLYDVYQDGNNYPRFVNIIQGIKNIGGNVEAQVEKEAEIFMEDIKDAIDINVDDKDIKEAIEYTIKNNYNLFNNASVEIKKDDSPVNKKKVIASLVMYAVTKDKKKAELLLRIKDKFSPQNKKIGKNLDNVINRYSKEIIVDTKKENSNRLPVYKDAPIVEVNDNRVPTILFSKRKEDFESTFIEDIKTTVTSLANKDFGLETVDIKITDFTDQKEIKKTDLRKIKITFKDDLGKKQNIEFIIPKLDQNGNFLINDYKKIIVNQLVLLPVFFPRPYVAKVITYYSSIEISNELFRGKKMYKAYMGGFKIPLSIILMYQKKDVKEVFNDFGLTKYEVVDRVNRKKNPYIIELSDGKYIQFDADEVTGKKEALSFFTSMSVVNFKKINNITSDNFFDGNNLKTLLIKTTGNKNAPFILDLIYRELIDPINAGILKNKGYPTEYYNLIVYLCKKITEPFKDTRNDMGVQRVRNVEVLNQMLYQQLMTAYNAYYLKRKAGDESAVLEFDHFKIFKNLVNNQLVRIKENVCPIEQLSLISRVTYVGPGGLKVSDAANAEMRMLHDSAYGQIDPIDTPEGAMVGVSQNLANGVLLSDKRGIFGIKPFENSEGAGILGPAASFTPFIATNEPTRMIMGTNQAKQAVPLLKTEMPMTQTGYESLYTSLLDEDFVKKVPVDGTIVDFKEHEYIKIRDRAGKIHTVEMKSVPLKSGQAVDGLSIFTPTRKIGDKVKKNSIIAEGSSIKDGVISQGSNALTAWMDFKGFTFEDGVVYSDKLLKDDRFRSIHHKKIELFLYDDSNVLKVCRVGETYKAGDALFVFTNSQVFEYADLDADELIDKNINVKAPFDCEILEVKVFPNSDINKFTKLVPIFQDFIAKDKSAAQNVGDYRIRGQRIEGVFIEISIRYEMSFVEGDKLTNRHGNKGVCATIVSEKDMPQCYDKETQVFTNNGWKYFKDLTKDDMVAYIKDMDSLTADFTKPLSYYSNHYNGTMYGAAGKRIDYLVTHHHRMFCKTHHDKYDAKNDFSIRLAEDIHGKNTYHLANVNFNLNNNNKNRIIILENYTKKSGKRCKLEFNKKDFCEFLGWYISEGSLAFYKSKKKYNGGYSFSYKVQIAQSIKANPDKCKRIEKLLNRMGLNYYFSGIQYTFGNKSLYNYLKPLGKCDNKYIPHDVLYNSSYNELEAMFNALIDGDGTRTNHNSCIYYTTSKKLANDMSILSTRLGYHCSSISSGIKDRKLRKYYIHIYPKKNIELGVHKKHQYTKEYNDMIYCVEVPNGLILVRRNGKQFWCGNTPWGEHIEICLNPLSIVNRGIAGQLLEIYTGLISWKLKQIILKQSRKKAIDMVKVTMKYLDNTKGKTVMESIIKSLITMTKPEWEKFKEKLRTEMRGFPIIVPPFKQPSYNDMLRVLKLLDLKSRYKLYLPQEKKYTNAGIPIGYLYFYKVEHMAIVKSSARSINTYVPKTMQPPKGKARGGGQRVGELDSWCLLSHNTTATLKELFGPLSDDQVAKRKMLENIIINGETNIVESESSPTRDLVLAYMRCLLLDG